VEINICERTVRQVGYLLEFWRKFVSGFIALICQTDNSIDW